DVAALLGLDGELVRRGVEAAERADRVDRPARRLADLTAARLVFRFGLVLAVPRGDRAPDGQRSQQHEHREEHREPPTLAQHGLLSYAGSMSGDGSRAHAATSQLRAPPS